MLVVFPMPGIPFGQMSPKLQKDRTLEKWAYRDDEMGHITVLCDDL